jgi:hypothetical protein
MLTILQVRKALFAARPTLDCEVEQPSESFARLLPESYLRGLR